MDVDTSIDAAGERRDDSVAEAMLERALRDYPASPALDDLLAEAGAEGPGAERLAKAAVAYAALLHA